MKIHSFNQLAPAIFRVALPSLFLAIPLFFLSGCGGGGGGNSTPSPTATPRATSTPAPGARSLVVQLRDSSGAPVDGIVSVGSAVLATSGGQVVFRSIAAGAARVSAEVNGQTSNGNANVAAAGSTTFVLIISSRLTPGPTSEPPPPPF